MTGIGYTPESNVTWHTINLDRVSYGSTVVLAFSTGELVQGLGTDGQDAGTLDMLMDLPLFNHLALARPTSTQIKEARRLGPAQMAGILEVA